MKKTRGSSLRELRGFAAWREQLKIMRSKYARRLADRLNQKFAVMPVKKIRAYLVSILVGMLVLNASVAIWTIRHHPAGPVSSASVVRGQTRSQTRLPVFDEKLYDSLEKVRPGLADSIKLLQSLH